MIDLLASEPQFLDHLSPVWRALEEPGAFMVMGPGEVDNPRETERMLAYAAERGIAAVRAAGGDRPILVASYGDVKQARRLGRTRIAFLEHGIGQSYVGLRHGSYAGGPDRDDVGLFLVPNEHAASRWRDAYPGASVQVVGSPKLDTLPAGPDASAPPVVAVAHHWACTLVAETMPAFAWFRTAYPALAKRYAVLGHGHPRIFPALARAYRQLGVEPVEDFTEVCRRAHVLIADNTSALYEFASTGRPVVVLNPPWYRRSVEHGLRFWEAATVGSQVDEPAQLLATVETALEDPDSAARERALDIVYAHRTGAAERAARAIIDWLAPIAVAA